MKQIKSLTKFSGCSAGILTNQSAFGFEGKYHFEAYSEIVSLKTLFLPEHGLFAELQDQVSGKDLSYLFGDLQIVNLYGDTESSLVPESKILQSLDLIIIDIRDVGSRYYTFLTSAFYMMEAASEIKKNGGKAPIFVIVDSPNPIGTKVEGSPLQVAFESFVGVRTVPHRHGLSPGGLLSYYNLEFHLKLDVAVVPIGVYHPKKFDSFLWVPPSPNIPTQNTCYVYPGQCLLEGTNLSEGRGTTKPFETFGAPYLQGPEKRELDRRLELHQAKSKQIRKLRFLPTFHKFKDQICEGYQLLILDPKKFRSLYFSLFLIKNTKELFPDAFKFLTGVYEFRSDKPAIELLVGDSFLLDYVNGKVSETACLEYLEHQEKQWILKTKDFRY
ncbi:hypothetical protein LPTSP4_13540 [Leptospira ryugenii]|uniref:PF07075 family protein n=1 Tax=Leptospira ryugenii TaxID=1917863 RepID=A0A2P2DYY3_9LEPT|nr:DUF1343 domain-containing protein [Leptospira ryugenii]GBF49834.1 hypothetical protein LPTSP4_13540 [Leptospira ryugenii]